MEDDLPSLDAPGRLSAADKISDLLCVLIAEHLMSSPARTQDETEMLASTLSALRQVAHMGLPPDAAMGYAMDVVASFKAGVRA